MNLQTELERVREYSNGTAQPPSNEANTCDWIIRPLLLQCGYNYHDIHAQGHDAAGNIPDYTILPKTDHTWFLEAKKWQENITDTHVNQAANYVNTTAKRWFVVSNGREWRLYDNYNVQVPPPNRLVTSARLECATELDDLLAALSKTAVQSGALDKYALNTRLATLLNYELAISNSDVIQAITKTCKGKSGLSAVTSANVMAYFQAITINTAPPVPPTQTPTVDVQSPVKTISASTLPFTSSKSMSVSPPAGTYTLSEMLEIGKAIEKMKRVELLFPNGESRHVVSWRDIARGVVEWLFDRNKIPNIPFRGIKGGDHCLINTTSVHPDGTEMIATWQIVKGQTFYVDMNRGGVAFVECLNTLCKEVGEAPEGFRVTLQ